MKQLIFFSILLLCGFNSLASEKSHFSANSTNTTTSDGFKIFSTDFVLSNHRRNLSWPYPEEENSAFDFSILGSFYRGSFNKRNYSGEKISLSPGYKFSKNWVIRSEFGWHGLHQMRKKDVSRGVYGLEVEYAHLPTFYIAAKFDDDFVYPDLLQRTVENNSIKRKNYLLNLNWLAFENWMLRWRGNYADFSDGNNRQQAELDFLYSLQKYPHWWWIGVYAEALSYDSEVEDYWSPEKYYSFGAFTELTYEISDYLSLISSLKISRFKENSFSPGVGSYLTAGVSLGNRNENLLDLLYERINSKQLSSGWHSDSFMARFQSSF